jgi:hypothetical protein
MKIPFMPDAPAALEKAKRKLADVEANIVSLKEKRRELLATADADNIAEIQTVNRGIEAEESARAIYADKIKALAEEVRRGEYQNREKRRKEAISKIRERLLKREKIAADIELALVRAGHQFVQLITPDELDREWPFPRPGHGWALIDRRGIDKELGWAMHGLCREHRFPEPNSIGLGVVGVRAVGVAELVRQQNENIIAQLETAPLHDDLLEEAI